MTEFSPEQMKALQIAHDLADLGAPLFSCPPDSNHPGEFHYPSAWQTFRAEHAHAQIERWKPGWALAMVCGVVFDVLDVDPRNGGDAGMDLLSDAGAVPRYYGSVMTPSDGIHLLIARTHLTKGPLPSGIDLQAGADRPDASGSYGRGFVFLAPTVRPSKWGPRKGQDVAYAWEVEPSAPSLEVDPGHEALVRYVQTSRAPRTAPAMETRRELAAARRGDTGDQLFEGATEHPDWTPEQADRVIAGQLQAVTAAKEGQVNSALGGAARVLGRFVAGGYIEDAVAFGRLEKALHAGGVHDDGWNAAHGLKWTVRSVVDSAFRRAQSEPWVVAAPTEEGGDGVTPDAATRADGTRLHVRSAADMAYWLQENIGRGRLSGFFARGGAMVHTPRVNELGYVPAPAGDDNGPAEIRPVTGPTLAAKLQYLFECWTYMDVKDEKGKKTGEKVEVAALFPRAATQLAVDAPEAMEGLRTLRGITGTPMVRADGSLIEVPGYDEASGYLFLPGPGVDVPAVPDRPTGPEVEKARGVLLKMIGDFPFATDDDRANYLGLLLTPMLREVAPPSYKLFGIGAHQPGSGKSLLAEIATIVHGGVTRAEVPSEESEWAKMASSVLATTSAPVVVMDNVTGVLRSSYLAGLLTASGEIQERELGSSRNLSFTNDRVWVVTGNNLSLGGDLVRRTVTILIDPDMASPESRTDFAIPDLTRWVAEHRNEVLWSLLVLIRAWVAQGMPEPMRKQSDSFARWERVIAGVLEVAGIGGAFDAESGKRAATGGDDDGLARTLDMLAERFGDKSWSVAEALEAKPGADGWIMGESRDWLPLPVLDKLARSEAAGRISLGWWLRNRIGRWVEAPDGGALVIREAGAEKKVARWRIERR